MAPGRDVSRRLQAAHQRGVWCCDGGRQNPVSVRPYRDPPHFRVPPARFHGDEPAAPDQNFGHFDRALPISDGVGSKALNISRADGGLGPVVLKPAEQPPCRQGGRRGRWLLLRPPVRQPFKEVRHRRSPLISLPRSPATVHLTRHRGDADQYH